MMKLPSFSYPPVTHHRLAEGISAVPEPLQLGPSGTEVDR